MSFELADCIADGQELQAPNPLYDCLRIGNSAREAIFTENEHLDA
jgi:hypothetical protein